LADSLVQAYASGYYCYVCARDFFAEVGDLVDEADFGGEEGVVSVFYEA